jgi:poly-beta-1,6-N-acetyl-D-glucosamine synthase
MSLVFWLSILLLAYVYVGYPALAWLRAALIPKRHRVDAVEPTVTLIVVAHNEEQHVGPRLDNVLALDYPRHRLEIIFASDGSTDRTVERARRYEAEGVAVRAFRRRRGKAAVLNDVTPSARGEIVVMADARQRFRRDALRALVNDFADPTVGAVSGELIITTKTAGGGVARGVGFYWRYEKFIRRNESRAGSTVGVTGAIYAIRRELFEPIPEDTILDDVVIPLHIVRRGYRVLFESKAQAFDEASAMARQEFVRKVRTIAGTFQLFSRETWLFDPRRDRVWLEAISHKGLRLATPLLQSTALAANIALAGEWPYGWLLAAQALFYVAALGGLVQHRGRRSIFFLTLPYTICLLSCATIVGFVQFITGRQKATWDRVAAGAARATSFSSDIVRRAAARRTSA